jgi:putative transcriptional regulator
MPYLRPGARWKGVLGGFEEIRLALREGTHRVSLLRLRPGKGLPLHRHRGSEYTVVLQGGYTDSTGKYGVGDFAVRPGPQEHEPIADPGEPCIALIVLEKPIVLTGPWGRWLNPLMRRGWI